MAQLTGGEVHYERKVKTGDYEHKTMSAKVTWSAAEDDSKAERAAIIESAAAHTVRLVHGHLGISHDPLPSMATVGTPPELIEARQIAGAAEHAPLSHTPPKRQRKAAAPDVGPTNPPAPTTKPTEPQAIPGASTAEATSDPLLDEINGVASTPVEIPIEDVTAAVAKMFGGGANRDKFPAFKLGLPKFAPQISAIAVEKRAEFLSWLNSL